MSDSLYLHQQCIDGQLQYIDTLIKRLTDGSSNNSKPPTLMELTPLFSTLHSDKQLLIAAVDTLLLRIRANNIMVRILSLHCIDALVERSGIVRDQLFISHKLSELFESTLAISHNNHNKIVELPPPHQYRSIMMSYAKQYIFKWYNTYTQYPQLNIAYLFLHNTMHIEFTALSTNNYDNTSRLQRIQRVLEIRYERCVNEYDDVEDEVSNILNEMSNIIDILYPELNEPNQHNNIQNVDTTDEWEDVDNIDSSVDRANSIPYTVDDVIDENMYMKYLDEDINNEYINDSIGDRSPDLSLSIGRLNTYSVDIEISNDIGALETNDNKLLFDNLRVCCKQIQSKYLPLLNEYTDTLIRINDNNNRSIQQLLLKRVSDIRDRVLQLLSQCQQLGVINTSNIINAADQLQQFAQHVLTPINAIQASTPSAPPSQQQYAYSSTAINRTSQQSNKQHKAAHKTPSRLQKLRKTIHKRANK